MADALVGSTGFVGSNLLRQHDFRDCYHSRNIEEIAERSYDLIVCSGMPAAKWIANGEPEADRANMLRLLENLRRARAERFVLISTIDVYPDPAGVDEDSPIRHFRPPRLRDPPLPARAGPEHFESLLILRLPALFGDGLKKNAVYDLLHDNQVEKIDRDAVFQWYDVGDLWADAERCLGLGLPLVNVATEPASMAEVARSAFGLEFDNRPETPPARHDFRTKHDAALGGAGGYLQDRATVLEKLAAYVRRDAGGEPPDEPGPGHLQHRLAGRARRGGPGVARVASASAASRSPPPRFGPTLAPPRRRRPSGSPRLTAAAASASSPRSRCSTGGRT